MYQDNITCVLFHGPSGSGKTETAKMISAPQGLVLTQKYNDQIIISDTIALAAPLIEMHSIKIQTQGANADDRQLWMLHQVFNQLIPTLSCPFDDFIEAIYDAQSYTLNTSETESGIVRDRDFMTSTADACHELADNPFAKLAVAKIKNGYTDAMVEHDAESKVHYLVIISDLRLRKEWDQFHESFDNIIKIKLDVSEKIQNKRLMERDNELLESHQLNHETQVSPFDDDEFDLVVKSDQLSLDDQVSMVKEYIFNEMTLGVKV